VEHQQMLILTSSVSVGKVF